MKELEIREKCSCGAGIGECHVPGCDIERCPFCGRQTITDECRYTYFDIDVERMEVDWKWVYENNLPEEMSETYEQYLQPYLLPWEGVYPGVRECREYGFWCKMTDHGWQKCEADDPEATEDLNELAIRSYWDKEAKRYVIPPNELQLEMNAKFEQAQSTFTVGSVSLMITPPLDEDYWLFRVKLFKDQAMLGFPKFGTIGIGFAQEEDWNTNLPSTCDAQQIYDHIKHNKQYEQITDVQCLDAIKLIQEAAKVLMSSK